MFDLDKATADWLGDLRGSGSFEESDVWGLRSQLKDEIGQLMDHGLSAKEAFWVARSRVEGGNGLPEEYATTGARAVWKRRFLWIGAGILAYLAFNCLVGLLSYGSTAVAAGAGIEWNALLVVSLSLQILFTCGAFLIMLYVLPNMRRFGIANRYQRMRQSRTGTVVLYVVFIALAIVLSLASWDGQLFERGMVRVWNGLLFESGMPRVVGESLMNAYSETMVARYILLVLLAISLVSIVFVLSWRKKRDPHVRVER